MAKSDSEWDQRVLCSDGNCIGVIGADGRCKVCGTPYDGDATLFKASHHWSDGYNAPFH